jgi:hypothetical protein
LLLGGGLSRALDVSVSMIEMHSVRIEGVVELEAIGIRVILE